VTWDRYNTDGQLIKVPQFASLPPEDFEREKYSLFAIRTHVPANGLVFVTFDASESALPFHVGEATPGEGVVGQSQWARWQRPGGGGGLAGLESEFYGKHPFDEYALSSFQASKSLPTREVDHRFVWIFSYMTYAKTGDFNWKIFMDGFQEYAQRGHGTIQL
jgi:hypothetical protein